MGNVQFLDLGGSFFIHFTVYLYFFSFCRCVIFQIKNQMYINLFKYSYRKKQNTKRICKYRSQMQNMVTAAQQDYDFYFLSLCMR